MVEFGISRLERHQLAECVGIWEGEGWSSKLEYFQLWYDLQPHGWFIATSDKGELLSVCWAWLLEGGHGRIARIATRQCYRGKGIGKAVLKAALDYLGHRNIGLSAYNNTDSFYSKFGFKCKSYKMIDLTGTRSNETLSNLNASLFIVPAQSVKFNDLLRYDTQIHKVKREDFLKHWLLLDWSRTFVCLNTNGDITGYISFWKSDDSYRIEPLYADDILSAKMLLQHVMDFCPIGETIQTTVYLDNKETLNMWMEALNIKTHELDQMHDCVQMYNHAPVEVDIANVYAVFNTDGALT